MERISSIIRLKATRTKNGSIAYIRVSKRQQTRMNIDLCFDDVCRFEENMLGLSKILFGL